MDDAPSSENGIDFSLTKQDKRMYHYLLKCNRCDRNRIACFHFMYSVFSSLLIVEHCADAVDQKNMIQVFIGKVYSIVRDTFLSCM